MGEPMVPPCAPSFAAASIPATVSLRRAKPGSGDAPLRPKKEDGSKGAGSAGLYSVRLAAERRLDHLAHRIPRQRVDEVDDNGNLVVRKALGAVRLDLLDGDDRAGARDDDRPHFLAVDLVRHRDDGGLRDGR